MVGRNEKMGWGRERCDKGGSVGSVCWVEEWGRLRCDKGEVLGVFVGERNGKDNGVITGRCEKSLLGRLIGEIRSLMVIGLGKGGEGDGEGVEWGGEGFEGKGRMVWWCVEAAGYKGLKERGV